MQMKSCCLRELHSWQVFFAVSAHPISIIIGVMMDQGLDFSLDILSWITDYSDGQYTGDFLHISADCKFNDRLTLRKPFACLWEKENAEWIVGLVLRGKGLREGNNETLNFWEGWRNRCLLEQPCEINNNIVKTVGYCSLC